MFIALFTIENRNRHPPCALTADTPVRTVFHHVVYAIATGFGDPLNAVYGLQRILSKTIDGSKPLLGRSENQRFFAPPAVRVAVAVSAVMEQFVQLLEVIENRLVAVFLELSFELPGFFSKNPSFIHRRHDAKFVPGAQLKVLGTMTWGCVNNAGSCLIGHVSTQDN